MKVLGIFHPSTSTASLLSHFQSEGILADWAKGPQEASEKLDLYEYDCVILELHDADSWQLLSHFVESNKEGGVIVLSKANSLDFRLQALNTGADDFISIPFHEQELLARIRAVVRRKKFNTKNTLYFGNLVIQLQSKAVKVWDKELPLTKKEYEMLLFFIANKEKVISNITLAEYLWGNEADNMDSFNLLTVHLKNLRRKLQKSGAELEIKNVYGVGYQLIEV